ncbi:hypothetical protein AB4371_19665 [Vibrio sp. 10N.261.51.A3]|uniref:hypothetical protein n=1 Tax=Vibrio sp. 10N.261.51.A3 TaxID=3229673 RepID=UPI0035522272
MTMSNLDKFHAWTASVSEMTLKQMIYGGNLNKSEICLQCEMGASAFKAPHKNKAAKDLCDALEGFEEQLRLQGILPNEAEKPTGSKSLTVKKKETKDAPLMQENSWLRAKVAKLESDNRKLEAELKTLKELRETVAKLGLSNARWTE